MEITENEMFVHGTNVWDLDEHCISLFSLMNFLHWIEPPTSEFMANTLPLGHPNGSSFSN